MAYPDKRSAKPGIKTFVPPLITKWQSSYQDQNAADKWLRAIDAAQRFINLLIELKAPISLLEQTYPVERFRQV